MLDHRFGIPISVRLISLLTSETKPSQVERKVDCYSMRQYDRNLRRFQAENSGKANGNGRSLPAIPSLFPA